MPSWHDAMDNGVGAAYGTGRLGGLIRTALVSGAAANTAITVTGLSPEDSIVSVVQLSTGLKVSVVAGAAAGNVTVTGVATEDRLVAVLHAPDGTAIDTLANLTAEFTITAADTINNTGGTSSANGQLWVLWEDVSAGSADRTAATSITAKNTIKISTATTGSRLLVTWAAKRLADYV